ncbi:MAG: sugar transferase [Acidimicrobiia bacterium]
MADDVESSSEDQPRSGKAARYAYMRSDGTLDIVLGSLVAGLGGYAFTFISGRSLGEEAFAPFSVLLTAHFLAFIIVLMPIEQLVIRRITVGNRGWVVPFRAIAVAASAAFAAAIVVGVAGDAYFDSRREFVMFALLTVFVHFFFAVGRGYLAGFRRFRSYGYVSAGASMFRLSLAVVVSLVAPSVTGFAWAHILGPLVVILWRPWRLAGRPAEDGESEVLDTSDRGLLSGLILAAAASQALLLAGPLVASRLGATNAEVSVTYATLLIARAPLTLGYNLIARVLPSFTTMAVRGERRELRSWARGVAIAAVILSLFGGLIGLAIGPLLVSFAFGEGFAPTPLVAALSGAGVVLAGGGLFIGQILVARGKSIRLLIAWLIAVVAAVVAVTIPISDPVLQVAVAFYVGEATALLALTFVVLIRDMDEPEITHGYSVIKRSVDISGALVAMFLLLPVVLVAAIAVKLDSPGPILFRQRRVGRHGDDFWLVKLRTMNFDHDDSVFKDHIHRLRATDAIDEEYTIRIEGDPRITRIGGKLRAWSIDELPNLWNVLKGSMSLVGPRPLVREEAELIGLGNPRFDVKPGITGYAQVHGRDSISLAERTVWDEKYVAQRGTRLDLKILAATVATVLTRSGDTSESSPSAEE